MGRGWLPIVHGHMPRGRKELMLGGLASCWVVGVLGWSAWLGLGRCWASSNLSCVGPIVGAWFGLLLGLKRPI